MGSNPRLHLAEGCQMKKLFRFLVYCLVFSLVLSAVPVSSVILAAEKFNNELNYQVVFQDDDKDESGKDDDKDESGKRDKDQPRSTIRPVLLIRTDGEGSVTRVPDRASYVRRTIVKLTARPDAGWYFSG